MPRKILPILSMNALLSFAVFAAISTACGEGAALPMQPAIRDYAIANSRTVSAISNTVLARRARRGFDGRGSPRHRAFGDGNTSSGFPGDLVGGTFPWPYWPYYNYCRGHNADANC
jgi:hypothetical protein